MQAVLNTYFRRIPLRNDTDISNKYYTTYIEFIVHSLVDALSQILLHYRAKMNRREVSRTLPITDATLTFICM